MSAARDGRLISMLTVALALVLNAPAIATTQPSFGVAKFLGGGALALAMHEGGHLVADLAFNGITWHQEGEIRAAAVLRDYT